MEDFITYELAIKLKEKGFKQGFNIFGYRPIFSNETTIKFISDIGAYENEYFGENISVPTISQVLKWLREKKEIYICIGYDGVYSYDIVGIIDCEFKEAEDGYNSYELAALAGIEYVIDNLI